ncbi:MAG: metallophosphoesterase [Magnetococcales bacterium]|nr:metallophosphoesterase [Magnetococcales bacterium]
MRSWIAVWLVLLCWMTLLAEGRAGPSRADVVFFALGDQGSGSEDQRRVAQAMERVAARSGGVDFVLLLGDNFYPDGVVSVRDPQWQTKFEQIYTGPILDGTPFYPIIGNHDARSSVEAQVEYGQKRHGSGRWRMGGRNGLLDQGGGADGKRPLVRLVLLDATLSLAEQNRFLQASFVPSSAQPVWRLVASHYPLRSSGAHGDSKELLNDFLPALRSVGVDVHLSGHDHHLELLRPPGEPVYVVSGAGGFSLYPLKNRRPWSEFVARKYGFVRVAVTRAVLELTFYDDRANQLHRMAINRR